MTYSVPLKVTFRLFVYDKDPETGRQDDARRQGRGGLLRRHPADDRQRHVRHQRHRARHRLPAPPLARRLLHQGVGARLPREDHPVPRLLGGVRVRPEGHPLRPHRPQAQVPGDVFLRALGLETDEAILRQFYAAVPARFERGRAYLTIGKDGAGAGGAARSATPASSARPSRSSPASSSRRTTRRRSRRRARSSARSTTSAVEKALLPRRRRRPLDRRGPLRGQPGARRRTPSRRLKERGIKEIEVFFPDWDLSGDVLVNTLRKDTHKTKNEAIIEIYRRMRPGDPPTLRVGQDPLRRHVLRRQEVRLLARRPLQVQHQARRRLRRGHADADAGGLLPRHRVPAPPASGTSAASTTSTTSATAACARSASCSRTSSASASSAWSAPSRRRCRSTRTSTRRCRTT